VRRIFHGYQEQPVHSSDFSKIFMLLENWISVVPSNKDHGPTSTPISVAISPESPEKEPFYLLVWFANVNICLFGMEISMVY
jgi:hypothetical protein